MARTLHHSDCAVFPLVWDVLFPPRNPSMVGDEWVRGRKLADNCGPAF
jgi:hypothetical protein